jgi:hypothetical protein
MKRLVALLPAALLTLTGCGDTCNSKSADVQELPSSCTLPAAASTTIEVRLCPRCTDSGTACQAEFTNGRFELDPTFQECQENAGCDISQACRITSVPCTVTAPSAPGQYAIVAGGNQFAGTANVVAGGSANCHL